MLRTDRHQQIMDFLSAHRSAQVNELSLHLNVSEATVRRDLTEMEEQGIVRRVHGGAVPVEQPGEPPILQRKTHLSEIKYRIGVAAAALVKDGDTIIITSGTTTEAMATHITTRQRLTVITNALNVAVYLSRFPEISVIVPGGWLRHSELSLLGHLTDQALESLRADLLFHGIYGLDAEYGLTGVDMQEVQTDRHLLAAARQLVILADHTKFSQVGPIRLAPIEAASMIITDDGVDPHSVEAIEARGIQVMRV